MANRRHSRGGDSWPRLCLVRSNSGIWTLCPPHLWKAFDTPPSRGSRARRTDRANSFSRPTLDCVLFRPYVGPDTRLDVQSERAEARSALPAKDDVVEHGYPEQESGLPGIVRQ